MRLALVLIAVAACSKDGGGAATGSGSGGSAAAGSAAAKKGAGFSASLSAELAKEGSGSAAAPGVGSAAAPAAGSAAVVAAGSAAVVATGSAAVVATGSAAAPAAGSAKGSAVAVADANPAETKPTPPAGGIERPSASRVPVKPSAEQAAIKLDLEPNWDRDVGAAGTISFVLKVPNTEDTRLFSFHYGYDPDAAPADRDAYLKWLGDQKILNVTLNRQRGAAWYLEGTDGNGAPAFRYLVNYGGKHLICYGSLYKDAASNQLGDLRDKVVMAAKKICETMTL